MVCYCQFLTLLSTSRMSGWAGQSACRDGNDPAGALGRALIRAQRAYASGPPLRQRIQDLAFQPCQFRRAVAAGAFERDIEVERDLAVIDDDDAVGQRHGFGDVMGDQHGGECLLQPDAFEQLLHLDAGEGIEGAERFVEGEDIGMGDEGAGERDALALAA